MNKYLIIVLLFIPTSTAVSAHKVVNPIRDAEITYRLPKGLLGAVAKVESNHNPKAFVRVDGCTKQSSYGLMQIQLASARHVGFKGKPKDLMKTEINVKYAAKYLRFLIDKSNGDIALALVFYNSGPYSEAAKAGRYNHYVGRVLNAWLDVK